MSHQGSPNLAYFNEHFRLLKKHLRHLTEYRVKSTYACHFWGSPVPLPIRSHCWQHLYVPSFPGSSIGKESACKAGDSDSIPGSGRFSEEGIGYPLPYSWASFVAKLVENPPVIWDTWVQSLVWKIPCIREWLPTPVFWPGEFQGLESDTTE